jgi:hypothetical protein
LTPASPLAINTLYTVTVDASVSDPGGNPLAASFVSTFRTATPDATAPRVESIDPPDGATGVPTTAPVSVTFTEPIDPATVTPASFRVSSGGTPVTGTFTFLDGGRTARFTPAVPYPFEAAVTTELTGAITDVSHNALVTSAGLPITTPLTFTFLTGNFAITSPAGTEVIENTNIALSAQASAALNVSSVVFSVNGTALPAVTAAPFSTGFNVPQRSSAQMLTIVASARNASNAEIARAEKTVSVVGGLTATPTILGLPRGATRSIRFSLDEPAATDLVINLSVADSQVASLAAQQITLPSGQTSVTTSVTACATCPGDPAPAGKAIGNTAVVATSSRGPAVTIVSVSDPIVGQQLTPLAAQTGLAISLPPSAGNVFTSAGRTATVSISLRGTPLPGNTPLAVTVTSSNANVATATATAIQPGQQTTTLTIDGLADGIAVLTVRAGDDVRSFTVFVGAPPANLTPLALAMPTGVSISRPPSIGQVLTAAGRTSVVTVQALAAPLAGTTPLAVSVSSSNPAIATATASPVEPGTQVTTVTITALADGATELTLRAGTDVRSLTVFVGAPPAGQTPIVLALPTGVSVTRLPFIGAAFAPTGTTLSLGVLLLQTPAATPINVTVTSSNPAVVTVNGGSATIPVGSQMVTLNLTTGAAGTATLTLEAGTLRRELKIVVGSAPTPDNSPIVVAPPTGVSVVPLPQLGRVMVAPGAAVNATLGVQLLTTARATDTSVTITTSDPAIATTTGGASTTVVIPAGSLVAPLGLLTTGTQGAALLRFEFDGTARDLVVVVGNPPASQIPAVTAPVIGVRIDQ